MLPTRRAFPVLAVALAALAAPLASADVIELKITGPIQFSNMSAFPVGQSMSVTFRYESAGSPQFVSNNQAFYVDHWSYFRIQSGGYDSTDSTGTFGQINKYNNLASTDGIQFQVASNSATYQYTNPKPQAVQMASVLSNSVNQTFDNIFINFAANNGAVWNDFTLPTTYNFAQFDQTINMLFGFSGGSFQVGQTTLLEYTNLSIPAPGAAAILPAAMLLAARRRRN